MEATLILNEAGLAERGKLAGVIATVQEQHNLFYDAGVGLYYRVNGKVETLATKVEEHDFRKIYDEIENLRHSTEKAISFNLSFKPRT